MSKILTPFGAVPNERQLFHYAIGKKAFFHVGMNTFTGNEWGHGDEDPAIFAPTDADVDSWVRTAKEAGFGLAILVCKHHDGFCLWPTATTEHSIRYSPYKNGEGDIVREFVDACHRYGVYVGLYVSLWDRHMPAYGTPAYNEYYVAQITELLTDYGPVHEIWWDGAGSTGGHLDYARFAETARRLQPDIGIFGALGAADVVDFRWVGNEAGKVAPTHYASIDREAIRVEDNRVLNRGTLGAAHYVPAEVDTSVRPGWFYHASQDTQVKSPETLNDLWFSSVGRNALMLLNFPVDTRGRIHDTDRQNAIASHRQIEAMLATDYMDGATLTADGAFDEAYTIEHARATSDGFFAAAGHEAVIDVTLPHPTELNVLLLSEEVTLGERITSLTLESVAQDGTATVLVEGTSVGYKRAYLFERTTVSHLRLTLRGAAEPTLRTIGLHLFEGSTVDPRRVRGENIMARPEARVEMDEDRRAAVLAFGGIYPFRKVRFKVENMGVITLSVFDGFSFREIYRGYALADDVEVFLDEEVEGSYQIRITTERPFEDDPAFYVG